MVTLLAVLHLLGDTEEPRLCFICWEPELIRKGTAHVSEQEGGNKGMQYEMAPCAVLG